MILHRYATKDGGYVWARGKTDAMSAARKHAKMTPSDITLTVEQVELQALTTKTLVLALLNGENVIAEEDDEQKITVLAEVRGRIKPQAKPPKPKPVPVEQPADGSRAKGGGGRFLEDGDHPDQEYVNVYTKNGFRLVKLEHLRPGMKVMRASLEGPACVELPTW